LAHGSASSPRLTQRTRTPNHPGPPIAHREGKFELRQQYLGRDAAYVEACASEGSPLLDAGGLEPHLRRLDRGHVPAGPAADHHHVALLPGRRVRPQRRRPRRHLRPPREQRVRRAPPRQARHRHLSAPGSLLRFFFDFFVSFFLLVSLTLCARKKRAKGVAVNNRQLQ
jgi:hypothetical protein